MKILLSIKRRVQVNRSEGNIMQRKILHSRKSPLQQILSAESGDDCIVITCGPGHGISIGSLGRGSSKADIHSVHVSNCKLKSTMNGLRIKTWQGGSGTARNITYENIDMADVQNPVIINQHYCDSAASSSCRNQGSYVKISDVTYKNIRGTSATKEGITFSCSIL